MKGIRFKRKSYIGQYDDVYDYYDPVVESDFSQTETHYVIDAGLYTYNIPKDDVVGEPEWYDPEGVLGEI